MNADFRLTGLIAAPHTPMTGDGQVHLPMIVRQAELLIEAGVRGAFVCGSTGEGHSLTSAERRQVAEAWVQAAGGRLQVIVHVGHNSMAEAAGLAEHAMNIGAQAISALAPSYYKPPTLDELLGFCQNVASKAPTLPFYFYDIPSMTGVSIPTAELLERGAKTIPTLHGVKYTNTDFHGLQECLAAAGGRFDIVFGVDEALLAGLTFGVRGAVGSTYNYAAPVYLRVMKQFAAGDLTSARASQMDSVRLVRVLLKYGVMRAGKAAMGMIGVECGPVRLPLKAIHGDELQRLRKEFLDLPNSAQIFSRPIK